MHFNEIVINMPKTCLDLKGILCAFSRIMQASQAPAIGRILGEPKKLTLDRTIFSPDMKALIRSQYPPLISLLCEERTLEWLMEWCISSKHVNEESFSSFSSLALDAIFSLPIRSALIHSRRAAELINNFLYSDDFHNRRLCANFSRISAYIILSGTPLFIKINPAFIDKIIQSIGNQPVEDIIVSLFRCPDALRIVPPMLVSDLAKMVEEGASNAAQLVDCMAEIFNSLSRGSIFRVQFRKQSVANSLYRFALNSSSLCQISKVTEMLCEISEENPEVNFDCFTFALNKGNLSPKAVILSRLFPQDVSVLPLILTDPLPSYLGAFLVSLIGVCSRDDAKRLADCPHFLDNLTKMLKSEKRSPYLTMFAVKMGQLDPPTSNKAWKSAVYGEISRLIGVMTDPYGGTVEESDDSSTSGNSSDEAEE